MNTTPLAAKASPFSNSFFQECVSDDLSKLKNSARGENVVGAEWAPFPLNSIQDRRKSNSWTRPRSAPSAALALFHGPLAEKRNMRARNRVAGLYLFSPPLSAVDVPTQAEVTLSFQPPMGAAGLNLNLNPPVFSAHLNKASAHYTTTDQEMRYSAEPMVFRRDPVPQFSSVALSSLWFLRSVASVLFSAQVCLIKIGGIPVHRAFDRLAGPDNGRSISDN